MYYQPLSLLNLIEEVRQELHTVAKNRLFTDDEVIAVSQKLDRLLNQYYQITGEKLVA